MAVFARNHIVCAMAHMTPESIAGSVSRLLIMGEPRMITQYTMNHSVDVAKMPVK